MISVTEAKNSIISNVKALPPLMLPLSTAAGAVLAEDIYALSDIPPFRQSAMDGYAFCFDDYQPGRGLVVSSTVQAGHEPFFLQKATAARIFTGAPVPEGADTVVIQEKVTVQQGELFIQDETLRRGDNVRLTGSDIGRGDLALQKATELSPAAIGFLAAIGVTEVPVYPKPSVTIIITGKELQPPGKPLRPGQVYESNSYTLKAALEQLHITDITIVWVDDHLEHTQQALQDALQKTAMVMLTGGISVGDYDFVLPAALGCGVTQLFHKVAQKPGKPLYFGMKGDRVVFGLPGNPSSVLTCFYEYVLLALEAFTQKKDILKSLHLPLTKPFSKRSALTHFLKGWHDGKTVTPLHGQESYRLHSFARANCLICLEGDSEEWGEGAVVPVHVLPA